MARVRSPNRDKAKKMYFDAKGDIKLVDIASQLNIKDSQVRKWKSQDKWDEELKGTLPKEKRSVTNKKSNKSTPIKEPIAEEVKEVLRNTTLTDKQRLFCVAYAKCMNATKAYQKVYECTYETAMVNGCKLLRNTKIKEQIDLLVGAECNKEFLQKSILQKYIDIAFADITDFLTFGQEEVPVMGPFGQVVVKGENITKVVNVVKFKESGEIDGTILSEVKQGKDGASIKLLDKMKALDFLAKHSGLLDKLTQEKLDIERQKLEIAKIKSGAYEEDEEIEDDGFIDALHGAAKGVWDNEEDS